MLKIQFMKRMVKLYALGYKILILNTHRNFNLHYNFRNISVVNMILI